MKDIKLIEIEINGGKFIIYHSLDDMIRSFRLNGKRPSPIVRLFNWIKKIFRHG